MDQNEPQICAVVDHPKLEHQWLWDIFGSKVRQNVLIDQTFDETEDLPPPPPKQELVNLDNVIDVPERDPSLVDDGQFDLGTIEAPPEPLKNWEQVLASIQYDSTVVEITKVEISGVIGKELAGERWKTLHSAPDLPEGSNTSPVEITDDTIRETIKETVLQTAEEFTVEAGYAATFKSQVYSVLMRHIRDKFLGGESLGLAERNTLVFAWKMLPSVKKNVQAIPGLIGGIIEYGN